ncbi:trypsin-like peptidase domain-containing protein [Thioclava sp. 'Guangxiensis']|uniref:trypsin-like peptidase domain-containing protein n=1 Tax=Thioclava sp. 'Guangxiensis' TaxID=3149044 RepID=UPI00387800EA
MRKAVSALVGAGLTGMVWAGAGWAAPVWLQIEAQPSLAQAEQSARGWSSLPDLSGFSMSTGWYAISIGPFETRDAANDRRRALQREGLIPSDAYVTEGTNYGAQFWPVGARFLQAPAAQPSPAQPSAGEPSPDAPITSGVTTGTVDTTALPDDTVPETGIDTVTGPSEAAAAPAPTPEQALETAAPPAPQGETLAESRRLEQLLSRADKMAIQDALTWQGYYKGALDASFGPGTRSSIAEWQRAQGDEPTGVLSSTQQAALLDEVETERAALGLAVVENSDAGIRIALPEALVAFKGYDAPFVQYGPKDGSGVTALLISRKGDADALAALYKVMQTLDAVPADGPRALEATGFHIEGRNDKVISYTQATLSDGLIKGFTLIWPADGDMAQRRRVLAAMEQNFAPIGNQALDPTLGKPMTVSHEDLTRGTDIRKPVFSRSGFYVDDRGTVATAAAGIDSCKRITIQDGTATLKAQDKALGLALLSPDKPLAPKTVARFQTGGAAVGSDIAAAGFSYPEAMSAPVLSFGTLAALKGLENTNPSLARLTLRTLPGDVGGPVLDSSGAVIGIVLPKATGDKVLPKDLSLALQAQPMADAMASMGTPPEAAEPHGALATEDLTREVQGMVVHVSCWK